MSSKTDQEIILELQKNGRMSYTELSSKLDISLTTAATRTEKLLSSNVLEIKAIPNPVKIGLSANAVILIQAEPAKISSICEDLSGNFNIPTILTIFGRFDIMIFCAFPNWDLMNVFVNEQLSRMDGILKLETFLIKEFVRRYQEIFTKIGADELPAKLNNTERKIIDELIKDGRLGLNEISESVGVHVSNVSRNIRSLINREIIKIIALPNAFKFGYNSAAFIIVDVTPSKADQICDVLSDMDEIYVLSKLVNGSGILIGLQALDNKALYRFTKEKIAQIDGVLKIESFITAELKKRLYGWLVKPSDMERLRL